MTSTSTLLIRTRSKSIPQTLLCYAGLNPSLPSPRIPNEITDRIVELVLVPCLMNPYSADFDVIASFTLASMDFRQIALRRYFHNIMPITKLHWESLFKLIKAQGRSGKCGNGTFAWVRSLCTSSRILSHRPERLSFLTHLRVLSIDFALHGLSTQHPCLTTLFEQFKPYSAGLTMSSLTLTNLPRIDVLLLRLIAKKFPRLTDLYLSCTERLEIGCCWTCFEDSLSCTIHSPIPDDYVDVKDMANAYASALAPLIYLTHLHLGIFLSDDQLFYSHITHSFDSEGNITAMDSVNQCSTCFNNAVEIVRMRELMASILIARQLKAVRSIGWSSFLSDNPKRQDGNGDEDKQNTPEDKNDITDSEVVDPGNSPKFEIGHEMRTIFWVLRGDGVIKVRKAPRS